MKLERNRRTLLIDDRPAIHEDFRKIPCPQLPADDAYARAEAALLDVALTEPSTPMELLKRVDARDRPLILKRPSDPVEVSQLAETLTAKWCLAHQTATQIDLLNGTNDGTADSLHAVHRS